MRGVKGGIVLAAVAAAIGGAATAWAHGAASLKRVQVTEKEFSVTPVPPSIKSGRITFVVENTGHLEHEFLVIRTNKPADKLPTKGAQAVTIGEVGGLKPFKPGQTRRLTLRLQPGKYVLICNLPAHYKAGQHASFVVTS